jgi:hypothetical protein
MRMLLAFALLLISPLMLMGAVLLRREQGVGSPVRHQKAPAAKGGFSQVKS